jgi:dihydroorotase/N-acyl-D-amino-acid deacylase
MFRRVALLGCIAVSACARHPSTQPGPDAAFDLVLENGHVVDGTGAAWFLGDVAIKGDRIARVGAAGSLRRFPAKERLDARGLVVAPGFIDIQGGANFPGDGRSVSKVTQGITTEITGEWPVRAVVRRGDGLVPRAGRLRGVARLDREARRVA